MSKYLQSEPQNKLSLLSIAILSALFMGDVNADMTPGTPQEIVKKPGI